MKNVFYKIIIPVSILFGQTQDQIKQAKQIIQRTGMSESQARNAAKTRGYTDKQIDAAIQKAKESEVNYKKPSTEIEKSNENVQEQVKLQTTESTVNETPLPTEESDLEIVDELKLEIESKIETDVNRLSYFGYDIFKRDKSVYSV